MNWIVIPVVGMLLSVWYSVLVMRTTIEARKKFTTTPLLGAIYRLTAVAVAIHVTLTIGIIIYATH